MRLPALKGKLGNWIYYVATLEFGQIKEIVKKIDNELHTSKTLSDMIQRSITDNVSNIKEYILTQEERFFNSLVLAVYDGDPEWIEVELNFPSEKDVYYKNIGFLKFRGDEKIFPVDGQHRVEAIKKALQDNPELEKEQIGAIFIGHKNTELGMKRSRRIFSTLNRYAKPVSPRDIIALDEDDIVAIVTRYLIEEHPLFTNKRLVDTKSKSIPNANRFALTSIIALYECNKIIFGYYKGLTQKNKLQNELRFRKSDEEIKAFYNYCNLFWNSFKNNLDVIKEYLQKNDENEILMYRNKNTGGHLIFRPIGLIPFIMALSEIHKRNSEEFDNIFKKINYLNWDINKEPWIGILWNQVGQKMMSSNNRLIMLIVIFLYDEDLLSDREKQTLTKDYKERKGDEGNHVEILKRLRHLQIS